MNNCFDVVLSWEEKELVINGKKFINECEYLLHIGENIKRRYTSQFSKTSIAERNKELKNRGLNRRCFIIGNGASVRMQDLSVLAGEDVFVVNEFWRCEQYKDICPKYYLMFDPSYFETNENSLTMISLEEMEKRICSNVDRPAFILPRKAEKSVRGYYHWDEWSSVYYIEPILNFTDGYEKDYDLTKPVPGVQNVVQYAMLAATYMGYSEIYVLGIEQTNILDHIEAYMGKNMSRYAFEYNDKNMQSILNNTLTKQPLENVLQAYAKIFHLYKEIYLYCQKRGIGVFNCTPESLVDCMPMVDFNSLL